MVRLNPIVDTGADYTLFDGATALYLGWNERDIVDRAMGTQPLPRLAPDKHPPRRPLHAVWITCG